VHIAKHNDRASYAFVLLSVTAALLFFCFYLVPPFFQGAFSKHALWALPFLVFLLGWYGVASRITVWRSFGVEQIVVSGDRLRWTRTALGWKRTVEIPSGDITELSVVAQRRSPGSRVALTALDRRYYIGDMLLHCEAVELARALRWALGLCELEKKEAEA